MDVSLLHGATEDLASFLSEASEGDLKLPTPCHGWDLGELYRHLVDENVRVAVAVSGGSVAPPTTPGPADLHGGGLEREYRRTAQRMKDAFAAVQDSGDLGALYEEQIRHTVIHTWDLTQALGFDYEPDLHLAGLVLRHAATFVLRLDGPDRRSPAACAV